MTYYFANLLLFTSYTPFNQLLSGLTAEKGLTFKVVGKGNIKFQTNINGVKRTITINNILYIPGFRSNLVSMSKLSIKGVEATFKGDKAIIKTQNRTKVISAIQIGQLYVVEIDKPQLTALIIQSKQKSTNFAMWHRCLVYAGAETICQMMAENLVDRLNICGKSSIGGLCKDCVYDKHTTHPYHDSKSRKKEILKHIHIDIWEPCQVQSVGGALYFMIIMDGFSSY